MDISIFGKLSAFAIFLPLFFGLYLFISRLNLDFVNKKILNNGLSFVNLFALFAFLISYFLTPNKEILNTNFSFISLNEICLNLGLLINDDNILFLIFSSFILTIISFYIKKYFNKKRRFIFTKQRFFAYYSLLSFFIYSFFASPNLFQSVIVLILESVLVLIFSYIDIFKNSANHNSIRFHRITYVGNIALLIAGLILFRYAIFSADFVKSATLNYCELESIINYAYGVSSNFEFGLISVCFLIAIISRLTIFPLNCYYSFFANSSNIFYLSVSTIANSLIGIFIFLKAMPIFEMYSDYILYFEIFLGIGILFSFIQLLFEQNIKIIFGYLISIINSIFIALFLNFDCEIILYSFFATSFVLTLILMSLFYKDRINTPKRLINKQFGFVLEKMQIVLFETLPEKTSNVFEILYDNILQNIIPFVVKIFNFTVSIFVIKTMRAKLIRNILIIFALIALFAIYIVLFGGLG